MCRDKSFSCLPFALSTKPQSGIDSVCDLCLAYFMKLKLRKSGSYFHHNMCLLYHYIVGNSYSFANPFFQNIYMFLLLQNSFSSCWFHSLAATEILDLFCKTDWALMLYATFGQI